MAETENRRVNIYFNNIEQGKTVKSLETEYRKLTAETRNLTIGSKQYNDNILKMRGLSTQLSAHRAQVRGVESAWSSAAKSIKTFGMFAAGALGIGSIQQLTAYGKEAIRNYEEQQKADAQLRQSLRETGKEADIVFQKLIKQAGDLQRTSIFADEQITGAQQMLAVFGLTGDKIEAIMPAIVNFASATNQSIEEATGAVIKGLNGQERGLKQYGLTMDLVTKDVGGNFDKITQFMQKFEGASKTLIETEEGRAKALKNQISDSMEVIGATLAPVKKFLLEMQAGVMSFLANNMDSLKKWFAEVTAPMMRYVEKVKELYTGIAILLQNTQAGNVVLKVFGGIWMGIFKAFGYVYDGLVLLIDGFERMIAVAAGVKSAFGALIDYFAGTVTQSFSGIADAIVGALSFDSEKIKAGLKKAQTAMTKAGTDIATAFMKGYNNTMKAFTPVPKKAAATTATTGGNINTINDVEENIKKFGEQRADFNKAVTKAGQDLSTESKSNLEELMGILEADQVFFEDLNKRIAGMITGVPLTGAPGSNAPAPETEGPSPKNKAMEMINATEQYGQVAVQAINMVSARQQQELEEFLAQQEIKKESIQDLYDRKIISEKEFNKRVAALDAQTDAKRKEYAKREARRAKITATFSALINTFRAVAEALPVIPLAVAVGALGAAQVASIAATPEPAFAKGGPTIANGGPVTKPTRAWVGEKGAEWVAPNWMLGNPITADIIGMLEMMRQSRGFATGGMTMAQQRSPQSGAATAAGGGGGSMIDVLKRIEHKLSKPGVAYIVWRSGDTRELYEEMARYDTNLSDNALSG